MSAYKLEKPDFLSCRRIRPGFHLPAGKMMTETMLRETLNNLRQTPSAKS
ncbi:MAG: hypothetical protein R2860_16490 [Desulfobacterales bacterium]